MLVLHAGEAPIEVALPPPRAEHHWRLLLDSATPRRRGIWLTSGDRTPWHKEGGKGTKPLVVHFQVRPSPLAD
jgi:hypothetical protein